MAQERSTADANESESFGEASAALFHDAPLPVYLRRADGEILEVNKAMFVVPKPLDMNTLEKLLIDFGISS